MHPRRERTLVIAVAAAKKPNDAGGLAVVTAPETHEFKFFGHRFGETKSRLDRLGAAREQLNVGDTFGQHAADQLKETGAGVGREAAKGNAVELLCETLHIMWMAVAQTADGDAGDKIEILIAVDVGDRATPGAVDRKL